MLELEGVVDSLIQHAESSVKLERGADPFEMLVQLRRVPQKFWLVQEIRVVQIQRLAVAVEYPHADDDVSLPHW